MKKYYGLFLMGMVFMLALAPAVIADEEAENPVGVAGCASIMVDPDASLEFQQGVCNAGEGDPATSCGASGHGTCSSPKLNDTLPSAGHCICISEEETVVEGEPVL